MTSATLHQIADLIGRLAALEAKVDSGAVDLGYVAHALESIRGDLYRIVMEARGTAETLLEILEEDEGDSPDESADGVHR